MEFVVRLANPESSIRYPLQTPDTAEWSHHSREGETTWVYRIALPALPADHIVVPSYAQLHATASDRFQFTLRAGDETFELDPVPAHTAERQPPKIGQGTPPVSCHIDCWHTQADVPSCLIELHVQTPSAPRDYLLTLSVRPLELRAAAIKAEQITIPVPTTLSQMRAADDIKSRICSPTALVMALSALGRTPDWRDTIDACYDPLTRAYGAWPLAIRWAARQGVLAAVEAISNWRDAVQVLRAGSPMVCSIRFAKGRLQGAPLESTSGHLVVLHGVDGDFVEVKDPAACDESTVDRRYRVDEFTEAWLNRRGAAYVFSTTTG